MERGNADADITEVIFKSHMRGSEHSRCRHDRRIQNYKAKISRWENKLKNFTQIGVGVWGKNSPDTNSIKDTKVQCKNYIQMRKKNPK